MASPLDEAGPATLLDAARDHRNDRPDTEPTSSRAVIYEADSDSANDSASDSATCRWKTARFHDQECSRYFDCPSHTAERRLPSDQTEEQAASPPLVFQSDELPYDIYGHRDSSDQESPAETPQPDTASSPEPSPPEVRSADWLPSTDSPGLAETTPLPRETQNLDAIEQENTQSGWSFAQSQPSITSSLGPYSDMERNDDGPVLASERLPEPPLPSTAQSQTYPSVVSGDYSTLQQGGQMSRQGAPRPPPLRQQEGGSTRSSDFMLPRWQPDAEVTYCPICQTQFSFFVRKHHCR